MIPSAALALALCALPSRPARAAAAPLDPLSTELLTEGGYEIRADGSVWDKIAESPVAPRDQNYVLSRLASARRLKALLEINNIINRYDAERKLTAEDREAVRAIARKNWVVFGRGPRSDFRSYFSVEEREELDKIEPRFDVMSPLTMTDPAPESATAAAPPAAAPAAVAPAPAPLPKTVPSLAPIMEPPALKRESPFAAAAAPAVVPAPPKPSAPELGVLKPWTPPAVSTPSVAASSPVVTASSAPAAPPAVAPVAAPAPPTPEPPKPAAIGAAEYEKFVAEGPYSKEGKALLEMIGKRAPDYCLPLLRRTVVGAVPQIVVDGARAGVGLRAGFWSDPARPLSPPVVALSPGPVFVEVKSGLFGARRPVLLPESPEAWAENGVARPALDAWRADAVPVGTENGDWGAVRVYADGSRRGAYSADEQAGELLEQILLLGLAREGLDASPYAARRWARAARLLFSARLKEDAKQDNFLDPDRREELRDWLDRPEEADDLTAASWSGSRLQILDPRRGPPAAEREFEERARASCARAALEDALAGAARVRARRVGTLESLVDAGVVDAAAAKGAAQAAVEAEEAERRRLLAAPPACPAADAARDERLRKSALLTAEAARAERTVRESKTAGGDHAP